MTSIVTSMGRMAAHTGQEIVLQEMIDSDYEFAPSVATMTYDTPAPVLPDSDGRYPVPMPGTKGKLEY